MMIMTKLSEATINGISYDITYSSTGQPSIYLGWEIDYDMRNICVIENDDYYIEYYYNANGIRLGKSIDNGDEIESVNYILDGSNIIKEIHTGANNYTIEYYYDSSDNIIGFTYNGSKYLYLKNLQNDVIGIVDSNNNIVVKYYYDAYGRIIKTLDTSGINLSTINPFRYRSYYQDNETGWYYLNSRYYNPLTNRFVTMDQIEYLGASGSVLSLNLYSYCENNPINHTDYEGHSIISDFINSLVNYNKKTKLFSISRSLIAGAIDIVLALLCCIPAFAPVGDSMILLQGIKNLGKFVGRSFVERMFKKIFSKRILQILFSVIEWLVKTVTGAIVNFAVGKIFDKLFGLFWSMSSLGNFIGATFVYVMENTMDILEFM